ncbi:nucleoside phosphorylase domain-containing protein [Xylariales sp. PMI_506]|nr:nucleoside phosphorylase domain-containing protein [Xylariales sp. PMI_506]
MQDQTSIAMVHEDYTVAVVCAMSFEMSAIRYMLDEEHPRLPQKEGDSNLYTLGRIHGHNVAIACLPGIQGKGAAAVVATNMARTFPRIKWRLFVGIGGGVPSDRHDIRLGDVVVSMPEGTHGGVVQYDLGRDKDDTLEMKGLLLPPPPLMRSAVELMRSNHLIAENKVKEYVSVMLSRLIRPREFSKPASESDILFANDYSHNSADGTCQLCDRSRVVERKPRDFVSPEIHYGLIASGDRVIKSATKRDSIVQGLGDILCFEMEAAGLMTEFPCLVIRGISDYSDSHKNDAWQHYAAATAAACATELLSCMEPEVVPQAPATAATAAFRTSDLVEHRARPALTYNSFHGNGIQNTGSISAGGDISIS